LRCAADTAPIALRARRRVGGGAPGLDGFRTGATERRTLRSGDATPYGPVTRRLPV